MKIEDIADLAAIGGLPTAAAVGWVAWKAWRTAEKSWNTADQVRRDQAEAEANRRHREMRPVLDVTVEQQPDLDRALLRVKLVGPHEVERYDRIRVEVRDDGRHRGARGDVTKEAIRDQVWGPFWFQHGIDGGSEDHRSAEQGGKAVTDEWLFSLFPALAPPWYSGGDPQWRKDYAGKPIRLRIEVGLGDQSWVDLREVDQPKRSAYEGGGSTGG